MTTDTNDKAAFSAHEIISQQADRAAFRAMYWGQKVACCQIFKGKLTHGLEIGNGFATPNALDGYLLLRTVEQMTEEEKTSILEIVGELRLNTSQVDMLINQYMTKQSNVHGARWIQISDYLRSIGILIPFRGYTVEQIIANGWAKIKEGN